MYQEHFGLASNLFDDGIAQGTEVYLGPRQKLASANLLIALTLGDSVAIVTGAAGVGKTTIASQTLRSMGTRLAFGWLGSVPLTAHELLEMLLTEFGFSPYKSSRVERLQMWRQFLNEMSMTETRVCILVENAERYSVEVLQALESLTAADPNGCPGANVVLTCQTPLAELISTPALASLKQRTRLMCRLDPLTEAEMRAYLEQRVTAAGGRLDDLLAPDAIRSIQEFSRGVIRVANNLCETALVMAATRRERPLTGAVVNKVALGLFGMVSRDPLASAAEPIQGASGQSASVTALETAAAAAATPVPPSESPAPSVDSVGPGASSTASSDSPTAWSVPSVASDGSSVAPSASPFASTDSPVAASNSSVATTDSAEPLPFTEPSEPAEPPAIETPDVYAPEPARDAETEPASTGLGARTESGQTPVGAGASPVADAKRTAGPDAAARLRPTRSAPSTPADHPSFVEATRSRNDAATPILTEPRTPVSSPMTSVTGPTAPSSTAPTSPAPKFSTTGLASKRAEANVAPRSASQSASPPVASVGPAIGRSATAAALVEFDEAPISDVPVLTDAFEPGTAEAPDDALEPPMTEQELDEALEIEVPDVPTLTDFIEFSETEGVTEAQAASADDVELDVELADQSEDDDTQYRRVHLEAIAHARALEEISNSMAETLFGDAELDALAATLSVAAGRQNTAESGDTEAEADDPVAARGSRPF